MPFEDPNELEQYRIDIMFNKQTQLIESVSCNGLDIPSQTVATASIPTWAWELPVGADNNHSAILFRREDG